MEEHDDPRLDNIQASYHMAEEIEDPTTVTRRTLQGSSQLTWMYVVTPGFVYRS